MNPIDTAVSVLEAGGLLAIPTETVYGLAADATNEKAVLSVFKAKGREADHPLTVHIAHNSNIFDWVSECPQAATRLIKAFWPGPLTLILPRQPRVLDVITAKQSTVGIRCPDHPMTQTVLQQFKKGVVAPSANRSGGVSPTSAQHVREELGDRVDYILDGGDAQLGIESTIIDYSQGYPVLLRPGHITVAEIEAVCQQSVHLPDNLGSKTAYANKIHYAPDTMMSMQDTKTLFDDIRQGKLITPSVILSLTTDDAMMSAQPEGTMIRMPNDPIAYAHTLYDTLRKQDRLNYEHIYIEQPPQNAEWAAVNDRLHHAIEGAGFKNKSKQSKTSYKI